MGAGEEGGRPVGVGEVDGGDENDQAVGGEERVVWVEGAVSCPLSVGHEWCVWMVVLVSSAGFGHHDSLVAQLGIGTEGLVLAQ